MITMAKLVSNVFVDGAWYGPDYPDAGDPPKGSVTNPAAYGKATEADVRAGLAEKVGEQIVDTDGSDDDESSDNGSSSSASSGSSGGDRGGEQRKPGSQPSSSRSTKS